MSCNHAFSKDASYETLTADYRVKVFVCLTTGCGAITVKWKKNGRIVEMLANPNDIAETTWKTRPGVNE